MQKTLIYLHNLSVALEQILRDDDDLYATDDIRKLVDDCNTDLKYFEKRLAKLSPSGSDKAVLIWRDLKAVVRERELGRLLALVNRHFEILRLQMQIIEGYVANL